MRTPEEVVKSFSEVWAQGDIDAALTYIADDCEYALYLSDELMPFAGEMKGLAAIEASLREMRRQFEYIVYRPHNFVSSGNDVRLRVEHIYRHRASGELLTGTFRLVFSVRGEKLCRGSEFHDRARVEAFMRLFASP